MMDTILYHDMEDIYSRSNEWKLLEGKTILLTGAYGMLASYITYFIIYLHEVKNIDIKMIAIVRSKEKFYKKFVFLKERNFVKVVESNLNSPIEIEENIDYIIHAASLASPQYYSICPVDVMSPNVIGNYYLLNLAVEKKIKGYLLFSTGDIYGSVDGKSSISEVDYGIMDTLDIHNCYSESKRMAETMCKAYLVQYGVPVKIARIWHTYAPTMDIKNDPRVFASFVKNIISREDIVMKSDGLGKRSFCYITDAVAGYFTILFKGEVGEAYNVCNESQFISISELADILVGLYPERGLKVVRKERDASEHYIENVLLVGRESVPSNGKLESLGWHARVNIKEGFDRVVRYIESGVIEN